MIKWIKTYFSWQRIARIGERLLALTGLFFIVYHSGFHLSLMVSGSMSPTLKGNGKPGSDYVLNEHVSSWLTKPKRWDLVTFTDDDGTEIMKRIVGLPHESVEMTKDGVILIDGEACARPESLKNVRYYPYGNLARGLPVQTHEGYYVLGDDSKDSFDSRFNPPLKTSAMYGRPWLIVWPLRRVGFVNP